MSTIRALPDGDRAAAERELVLLARSAALGDLAADVAHDVANPLFGVLGLVDLLLEDASPGTDDEERLRLLHRAALEMKATVGDLLDFARQREDAPRGDLAAAVRSAIGLLRHGTGRSLELTESLPAGQVLVACAGALLEQAALHLLLAARDAGGALAVEVAAGALLVSPAGPDSLGVLVAGRIATDHGGTLERDGGGWRLRLPTV